MAVSAHYAGISRHGFLTRVPDDYAATFSHVCEISIYKMPLTIHMKGVIAISLFGLLLYNFMLYFVYQVQSDLILTPEEF